MTTPSLPARAIGLALGSADAEERRQATAQVTGLVPGEAIPLLLQSLGDGDWRVRKEAALAARAFAAERSMVDALLDRLEDPRTAPTAQAGVADVGLRNAIVEVLAACGESATRAVAGRFSRFDADGRKLLVEVLGRSRDPAALDPLEAALGDDDENVRQAAVEAIAILGAIAGERALEILTRCLEERDALVRLTALEGLNALGAAVPWLRLERLVGDPSLRGAAMAAAALSESPEAAPVLAAALASSRSGAFEQALAALAKMADGPLAAHVAAALRAQGAPLGERLVALVESREPLSLRSPHAGGIGGSGVDRRGAALLLAAAAQAPGASEAAIAALQEETLAAPAMRALTTLGVSALPAILARLASKQRAGAPSGQDAVDPEADARAALVDVVAAIARSEDVAREAAAGSDDTLREALKALRVAACDPARGVSTSALFNLSRLGIAEDLRLCAELCVAADVSVAHAAEGALAALAARYPDEARALANEVAPADPFSVPVVLVLGALGASGRVLSMPGADLGFLAHAAASGDPRTRRAAVAAVAEIGIASASMGLAAYDVLGFALADEARDVQIAAARALGRLCARGPVDDAPTVPARDAPDSSVPPRSQGPRASDVLELVGRSQDDDLLAATVRALGEAAAQTSRTLAPPDSIPPRLGAAGTARLTSSWPRSPRWRTPRRAPWPSPPWKRWGAHRSSRPAGSKPSSERSITSIPASRRRPS